MNFFFIFFMLLKYFLIINCKYYTKIFRCIFQVKNLHKLFNDYSVKIFINKSEILNKLKELAYFFKCFEVYCQIVLDFTFIKDQYCCFQFAITQYCIRLFVFLNTHIFDSIFFYKTFVYVRICKKQNNLFGWFIIDHDIEQNYLIRRYVNFKPKIKNSLNFIKVLVDYYRKFNLLKSCAECQYKHNCFHC